MADLETFAPVPRIVTLNDGTELQVLPLRLGRMPAFTKAVKPIAGSLFVADYFTILEEHPQAAIDTICAAGFAPAMAQALYQDETVRLLSAIYEVNGDFFIQRLRPAMTQAAEAAKATVAKMAALTGEAPSPSSSSAAAT